MDSDVRIIVHAWTQQNRRDALSSHFALLHRYRLREIAWLVDFAAADVGDVIG
jgi:hypothetical protein